MSKCKQCWKELNPVQAMLSAIHGVCGECTRKNQKIVFLKDKVVK